MWSKNNGEEGRNRVRLDQALANNEWQAKFQGATLHHIAMSAVDHSLLPLWFPHVRLQPQGGGNCLDLKQCGSEVHGVMKWFKKLGRRVCMDQVVANF